MEKKKKSKIQQGMLNRYRMIFIIIALFAILIATMLFKTTVVDAPLWNEKAAGTLVSGDSITPERGKILASDGSILSVSVRYYMVRLDLRSPNFKPEAIDSLLPRLCSQLESLHTQPQRTAAQWKVLFDNEIKKEKSNRSRTFLISKKMTKAELDTLRTFAYLNSRNGRTIITAQSLDCREKPFGRMAARSIGNINDLKHGTSGLEKELDSLLYGKPGVKKKVQLTTAIKEWEDIAAINGYDILTTIDVQIQDILETELYNMCVEQEPEWATAVLMDVKTGDIKAISNLSWNETAHDYIETVNHAVRSWELGSVMKPISLAIAIEDGFVHASTPVTIGASFPYAQARPITDTHSIGANPTVTEVLAGSSNIGTARIITSHYGEKPWEFRKRLEEIGFFESLNIGISGESRPTIQPLGSPDKRMENPWRINLSRCCYGYAVQQSPVTNLAIINAIANDGKFVRPRLVKELWRNDSLIKSNPVSYVRKQAFSPKTASEVRSMLRAVVWSDRKGVPTASRLQNNFVEIAGKTGTARIMEPGVGYTNKLRVTFTGFFPYDKPMYSCIVVFNAPRIRSAQLVSGRVLMNTALKMYARGMLGNKSDFRKEDDNTHRAPTLMAMSSDKTTRVLSQMKAKSYSQMKSKGNEKGMVPNVLGMGLRDAVATLERCGVTVTKISGSGYVTQQIPAAGSPLRKGTKATLHLNN